MFWMFLSAKAYTLLVPVRTLKRTEPDVWTRYTVKHHMNIQADETSGTNMPEKRKKQEKPYTVNVILTNVLLVSYSF